MGGSQCGSGSHLEGKMVSGISMTIVGPICNDSPDYRQRGWELSARAGKPIIHTLIEVCVFFSLANLGSRWKEPFCGYRLVSHVVSLNNWWYFVAWQKYEKRKRPWWCWWLVEIFLLPLPLSSQLPRCIILGIGLWVRLWTNMMVASSRAAAFP